ncbi:hypothetical protein [Streptomyces sp. NPDC005859]|uniref:hypothetical protein n=1 Tax=Streptomyces sp. NPDC005859 TaxID=3157170 RepID=UPI0033F38AED
MNASKLDSYRSVASTITPAAVRRYLAAHSWRLEASRPDIKEIWQLSDDSGRPAGRILLPLSTDFVDFPQRFNDAIFSLGQIYDWSADQLLERIMAARADLFFVRLDQEMTDGTIPFRQAETTLEALLKMLKAAATSAADPNHSHLGRRPAQVTDFLDDDVRLGHTKRGSFVFTVVTRLGDESAVEATTDSPVAPFARRVMATLAEGLEETRRVTASPEFAASYESQVIGMSASLVESLEDMTQTEGIRELDLSFDWANVGEPPSVGRRSIVLDRTQMEKLPAVRERLTRREEPPRRETLVGSVRSLSREEAAGDDEVASVIIAAEVRGRLRNVHMELSAEDHDWAILAYRNKIPITVSGDLAYERRAWRFTGRAELDTEFLRHRFGENPQA